MWHWGSAAYFYDCVPVGLGVCGVQNMIHKIPKNLGILGEALEGGGSRQPRLATSEIAWHSLTLHARTHKLPHSR